MPKLNLLLSALLGATMAAACARPAAPFEAHPPRAPAPTPQAASTPAGAPQRRGSVSEDVPSRVEPGARYLFYLHGAILEGTRGRARSDRFGVYEYERILDALAARGFNVISEVRRGGASPSSAAEKLAGQVRALLGAGVAPERITVVGASRGGGIALIASMLLRNRDLNFVVLASCADSAFYRRQRLSPHGNLLSIYDRDDDTGAGSCRRYLEGSPGVNRRREIVLETGLGHGVVYRPLEEWLGPASEWAGLR